MHWAGFRMCCAGRGLSLLHTAQCCAMLCNAVQCCAELMCNHAVLCNAMQCLCDAVQSYSVSAVLCCAVMHNALQGCARLLWNHAMVCNDMQWLCSAVQCSAMLCEAAVESCSTFCSAIQCLCDAVQSYSFSAVLCCTVMYNALQVVVQGCCGNLCRTVRLCMCKALQNVEALHITKCRGLLLGITR